MMIGMAKPARPRRRTALRRPNVIRMGTTKTQRAQRKIIVFVSLSSLCPLCLGGEFLFSSLSLGQIDPQGFFHRLVGAHRVIINLHLAQLPAKLCAERVEILQILLA